MEAFFSFPALVQVPLSAAYTSWMEENPAI